MDPLAKIVEEIIRELTQLQNSDAPLPREDGIPFPRMIPTGDGRSIAITKSIENAIAQIAHRLMDNDPSIKSSHSTEEWTKLVRNYLGEALAPINLSVATSENALTVWNNVKTALNERDGRVPTCTYVFGCTLFGGDPASPFSIGPVIFENRNDWLERQRLEGSVKTISYRRIARAWAGEKLRDRKRTFDSTIEEEILDAIGSSPYVVSIETAGLAQQAGKEKALTAARLALTAVALLAPTPSAALNGFNLTYDRKPHRQKSLALTRGKLLSAGSKWSHHLHWPWLKAGEWENIFAANSWYFEVVGEVLDYVLNPAPESVGRQKLMNALAQSLLWFHEGCRDQVTLMAIVNFAASMDALSGGKKSRGIRQLVSARLGMKDDTPVHKGGQTMKSVIENIYERARSRTIHGTNDRLGHDWSTTRGYGEQFAMHCLMACIDWVHRNPGVDDPDLLRE